MKRLPRKWIEKRLNNGCVVQCAVTASNACYWCYLTTSGQVTRREYGFEEDCCEWHDTISLPRLTFSSIERLNTALANLYNET
jgi:hypothetical protein